MTRWKASAIHLALSVLVLATIAAVLVWRWYPPGLFQMAHADKLLLIIAGVDVVMGPLLTLIVYKQGKKSLKFDLTVIALLQLAAMGYGLHTVWQSRPVYMVAVVDRFNLMFANDFDAAELQAAPQQYRTLPWLSVETVAAVAPEDSKERQDLLFKTLDTGKDLQDMPRYYAPLASVASGLLTHALSVPTVTSRLPVDDAAAIDAAVRRTGLDPVAIRVLPIASRRGDATMLVDAVDAHPVQPVAVDPWPAFSARRAPQDPAAHPANAR